MTLKELKRKVLVLIEEYAPNEETKRLTADDDIENKMNDVINQNMFEICRKKKLPKYIEMEVNKGDLIDFERLEMECGYAIYQIRLVSGVDYFWKNKKVLLEDVFE